MTSLSTGHPALDRTFDVLVDASAMPTAARYEVEDPTTGARLTDAPDCSAAEVDTIVRAAAALAPGRLCRRGPGVPRCVSSPPPAPAHGRAGHAERAGRRVSAGRHAG